MSESNNGRSHTKASLKRYSYDERRLIMEQKFPDSEIAIRLNVSIKEVERERKRLSKYVLSNRKYSLRTCHNSRAVYTGAKSDTRMKYTYEDNKMILERKLPDKEIARMLGVTEIKVRSQRQRLLKIGIRTEKGLMEYHGISPTDNQAR